MATTARLNPGTSSHTLSVSDHPPLAATRAYHAWQGNNTICCGGRIIGGPQSNNYFWTLLLILVPSILFAAVVCYHYMRDYGAYYVVVVHLCLCTLSIASLTMTAFSDPGIIPRGILASSYNGPAHLRQRMCISGQLIEIKWCSTCKVFRPPRSFHCYICNNCIERFDHHCPWIGNCIGVRNYAYFSVFVNSLQFVCLWVLAHCIHILVLRAEENAASAHPTATGLHHFVYALKYEWCAFITAIYVFIAMWFVIGLASFHCFLVAVGKTTNEQLRNLFPAGSPFKRSLVGNMVDMCCRLPKSALHLHHLSPTANSSSSNEVYVNKHKVILLDQAQVQRHNQQTHCMHLSDDKSPFKACLVNDLKFGYPRKLEKNVSEKLNDIAMNNMNGKHTNGQSANSASDTTEAGVPMTIMTASSASHDENGSHGQHAYAHVQHTRNTIIEEEEDKVVLGQEHKEEEEKYDDDGEAIEEQKYDDDHVHERAGHHRRQFSNMDHSISASRKDEEDQETEMLYPSGEDEDDGDDDGKSGDACNPKLEEEEKDESEPNGGLDGSYHFISTTPPPNTDELVVEYNLSRSRSPLKKPAASKILLGAESPQPDVDEEVLY